MGKRARGGRRTREQRALVALWLPLVLWMGLLWTLSDRSSFGAAGFLLALPNADKVAHAIAFGVLAVLFFRPFAARRVPFAHRAPVLFAVLLALAYGLLDECHQAHVPGRDPSVWDLLADLTGAALAGLGLILWTDRPRGPSRVGDAVTAARTRKRPSTRTEGRRRPAAHVTSGRPSSR